MRQGSMGFVVLVSPLSTDSDQFRDIGPPFVTLIRFQIDRVILIVDRLKDQSSRPTETNVIVAGVLRPLQLQPMPLERYRVLPIP